MKLERGVIPSLSNGTYAIFKDEILIDMIDVENIEGGYYPIVATMGSDEIQEENEWLERLGDLKSYDIVLASKIHLL